jgi:hypothetical protein
MYAVSVELAWAGAGQIAVKGLVGVFRQFNPGDFLRARAVEEADLHFAGGGGG